MLAEARLEANGKRAPLGERAPIAERYVMGLQRR